LTRCGLELIVLEADERYPDGYFVEDTAIVTDEVAVITSPGAASRMGEEAEISETLSEFRKIETIKFTGTLDGGDVLRVHQKQKWDRISTLNPGLLTSGKAISYP
jgi:dimethylargininase